MCYCFDETESASRAEIRSTGQSAVQRIRRRSRKRSFKAFELSPYRRSSGPVPGRAFAGA